MHDQIVLTFWLTIKTSSKIPTLRISTEERRKITLFTWKREFFSFETVRDVLIMYIVITDK